MATSQTDPTTGATDDHNWASVVGAPIFDQVMLAIIQANPDDHRKATAGQRLLEARQALLGQPLREGRTPIDDHPALAAMAETEVRFWARGVAVSSAALAKLAGHLTTGASSEAIISRLVRSYNASRSRLIDELRYQDDIAVSIERQIVEKLLNGFKNAGVNVADVETQFKSPVVSLGRLPN